MYMERWCQSLQNSLVEGIAEDVALVFEWPIETRLVSQIPNAGRDGLFRVPASRRRHTARNDAALRFSKVLHHTANQQKPNWKIWIWIEFELKFKKLKIDIN